jgi:hypothetical protein
MKLPNLEVPEKYTGLYVFDFGEQVAVGYTGDEIAVLLESEKYADGKVYRIHRALPDGTMELQGVARERFTMEDGLLFSRGQEDQAGRDFNELSELATQTPPPCRMKVHLARLGEQEPIFMTAAIFPAEFTHEVAEWMNRIGFEGGDRVEGGPSQISGYYQARPMILDRKQCWPAESISRSAEEVLSSTHQQVQRIPA